MIRWLPSELESVSERTPEVPEDRPGTMEHSQEIVWPESGPPHAPGLPCLHSPQWCWEGCLPILDGREDSTAWQLSSSTTANIIHLENVSSDDHEQQAMSHGDWDVSLLKKCTIFAFYIFWPHCHHLHSLVSYDCWLWFLSILSPSHYIFTFFHSHHNWQLTIFHPLTWRSS